MGVVDIYQELTNGKMIENDELLSIVEYDKINGLLISKVAVARRKVGDVVGTKRKDGYVQASIGQKRYLLHRLIWMYHHGEFPASGIDHINRNKSDNRIENLRVASQVVNMQNASMPTSNKSGYVGVTWNDATKKWRAQIFVDYKNIYLGTFTIKKDAISAREIAEKKYGFHENHGRKI